MLTPRFRLCCGFIVLATALTMLPGEARAQAGPSEREKKQPVTSYDRRFLGFVEDATLVDRQWWEASFVHSNGALDNTIDVTAIGGTAVFQPWKDVEIGGRLGFGSTDTSPPNPDGRGATDFNVWGKYYLGNPEGKVDLAVGVEGIIPTGDNTSGLGFDAFALGFFGALRWELKPLTLSFNAGFQINEDGEILNSATLEGQTSEQIGVAAIVPISKRLNIVGEWSFKGERFEGLSNDSRLLAGVNWRLGKRGLIRGAISGGLTDGAPKSQLFVSYAIQFR